MASKSKLKPKQEAFCREYMVDLNATQAAIRAGYSKKTANEQAARMLAKVNIKEQVQKLAEKQTKRTEIDADYVLKGIREVVERQGVSDKDKLKGYELLGRHLAMFTDKREHSGSKELLELLRDIGRGE